MSYSIEITRDALRALNRIDRPVRRRIQADIDDLVDDPRPQGVAALRGLIGVYRIRVGDYRVIYTVDDDRLIVVVVDLGHRREIYRNL